MSAQHTPGPWRYELDGNELHDMRHAVLAESTNLWVAATYRSGTSAENDKCPEADKEAAANARLIAAAPELLEALSSIRTRMHEAIKAGCTTEEAYDSFYSDLIDEAIAKATGSAS